MYGVNNRNYTIASNEQLVSSDFYGGGRRAVNEYILLLTSKFSITDLVFNNIIV